MYEMQAFQMLSNPFCRNQFTQLSKILVWTPQMFFLTLVLTVCIFLLTFASFSSSAITQLGIEGFDSYNKIEEVKMLGKGKQFKIERKKLVISKDYKPKEQEKPNKQQHQLQVRLTIQKRSSFCDKRQVQPLRQYRIRSSSRDIMPKNQPLLLEKKSTMGSQSKEMETKESQVQRNPQEFRMIWRNQTVEQMVRQLIERMKDKEQLFHSQNHCFLIQKDYFVHLLEYMICIFSSKDLVQCHRLFHKVSELKDKLMSISRYCVNLKTQVRQNQFSLSSKVAQFKISRQDYEQSLKERANLVDYYNQSITVLEERLKQLQRDIKVKEKYNEEISQEASQKQRAVDGLFLKITELEQRHGDLQRAIQNKTVRFEGLSAEVTKLQKYGCQNRQIIKLVSKQYKEIQSNIYEYAVYLQSNQLASHLGYEPHPFTSIQETLNNEYKSIQALKRDCAKANLPSFHCVVEIQDKMIAFYKKKDQQMTKLGEFKTKCVKQFINHMKKWLNNWQLKQEFLVNLRCQFAADTQAYHKCFNALSDMVRESKEERTVGLLQELQSIYNKIEENYKLGNSFY